MQIKIEHTHIRCQDLEAAVSWYEKVLGCKVLRRGEVPGMPIVRMDFHGQVFSLSPPREGMTPEPLSGNPRYGVWQIAFEVDDMAAAAAEFKARGAEFEVEPFQQTPTQKVGFIKAPDGVQIELLEFKK